MVPVSGVGTYRPRVGNGWDKRRPAVYIVRFVANVEASITGTVWKVEVAVGDEIAEGDVVVILESMKMEMPIESEDDGTVAEIRVEAGQSVQEGDILVVLS
jgi:acetyl-CoA carboxylase biotin carboxyl carrier protein